MRAKKILKSILKVFIWVVAVITGLLLLISISIYLPPIQNLIKNQASKAVSQSLGMNLSIGKIRLSFPLSLKVDNILLSTPEGDTLTNVEAVNVNVALSPLFAGNVVINNLTIEKASVNYRDSLSSMLLSGTLGEFSIQNIAARPKDKRAHISRINISDADINLDLGESPALPDTTASDTSAINWMLTLRRLNIDKVKFTMHTHPEITELIADLDEGYLRNLSVDLGNQDIEAELLQLDGGKYTYLTDTTTVPSIPSQDITDSISNDSTPWSIQLARLEIDDNAVHYGSLYGGSSSGFDPSDIRLNKITIRMDSIYNRGSDVKAVLRTLSMDERSGLSVTDARARFSMNSDSIVLQGFDLQTSNSHLNAQVEVGTKILEQSASAPLAVTLNAEMGMEDLFLFYPGDQNFQNTLKDKTLSLDGEITGNLKKLSIRTLQAQLEKNINLTINGNIRSINNPAKMSGALNISGNLSDLNSLRGILPDSALRQRIGFPTTMRLNGSIAFNGEEYKPSLHLFADSSQLSVRGAVNMHDETYIADVILDDFPLGTFLPYDSLGQASLILTAEGRNFDPTTEGTEAKVDLEIQQFDYKAHNFSNIVFQAVLAEQMLHGKLSGKDEIIDLELTLGGGIAKDLYSASINGRINNADLYAMGFSADSLNIATDIGIKASADMANTIYKASVTLDTTDIVYGRRSQHIGTTTLEAYADTTAINAKLLSGDLEINFTSSESVSSLSEGFSAVASEIMLQLDSLNIDMIPIQKVMPRFRLDISAGRNNGFREYLRTTGIDFNKLSVSAGNNGSQPVGAGIIINGLRTGELTLDTLNIWILQREERLAYALRLRNRPGNIEQMAFIGAGGDISGNTARMNLIQHDRSDSIGFMFGITAQLLDSAIRATLTPQNPIFGYRKWSVNDDNYLTYYFDKRIEANLRLAGKDKDQFFRITSDSSGNMPPGSIGIEIGGIELSEVFSLFPAPLPVSGTLNVNGAIGLSGPIIKGNLTLGIDDMKYDNASVGDISFGAIANTDKNNIWNLDLHLSANGQNALTAQGTYDVMGSGTVNMKVMVPDLSLELANAFMPSDYARLNGKVHGELNVSGNINNPKLNGGVHFEAANLRIPMTGTTFGISDNNIAINNNRMMFRDFGLVAPNNEKLSLDGTVDLADLSAINVNLRLFASNFEAVNSTRNGGSQIYGRGVLDVDMSARGLLDALMIRGNINILSRTDLYYTMRESPLEVTDAKQDIVTFVSFADEQIWAETDSIPVRRQSSMDLLVNVDIQDNVEATVNLSENGNDRIELIGDGALSFTMNNQGDVRLTGRYTLSGGTVVYNPPVISQKTFGIDNGSYVEWTGDLTNPSFNITATESEPIRIVSSDETTQLVNFDITVNISNSLKNMAIRFNLSAPNNGDIQNYLASLAPEQRASQAMYMLITNSYLGDGTAKTSSDFDVNQQIGSFISKELNQWARNNLSGVDISVGIDSVEDESGAGSHMDYSYSVSKSLFDDRVKVTIGGSVSDKAQAEVTENLVDDISIEYRLTKRDNMFLKVYRYNTQESILEGEITETGVGFILRKKMDRLRELFNLTPDPEKRQERYDIREMRRDLREEERFEIDSLRQIRIDSLRHLHNDTLPSHRGFWLFRGERHDDSENTDDGNSNSRDTTNNEALSSKEDE